MDSGSARDELAQGDMFQQFDDGQQDYRDPQRGLTDGGQDGDDQGCESENAGDSHHGHCSICGLICAINAFNRSAFREHSPRVSATCVSRLGRPGSLPAEAVPG